MEQTICTSNKTAVEFQWQRLLGLVGMARRPSWLVHGRYSGCDKRTEGRDLRSSGVYLSSEYDGKLQGAAQRVASYDCPSEGSHSVQAECAVKIEK